MHRPPAPQKSHLNKPQSNARSERKRARETCVPSMWVWAPAVRENMSIVS